MLSGRRADRVGDLILREVAILLIDKIKDPRVKNITITGIDLSNDLRIAKVYFSVIGDSTFIGNAKKGLESAKGFIRKEIGRRLSLKYVPEVRFIHDTSMENAGHMDKLFENLKQGSTDGRSE